MTITVAIDDAQLPAAVQRGAQTVLSDPVDVMTGWSQLEQVNRKAQRRPRQFTIGYGIKQQSDRQAIIDLFMTNGNLVGFLFKDWSDYSISNQRIDSPGGVSIANGTNRDFYLFKTYSNTATSPRSYERQISRPDSASIAITVNGTPSTQWTLQPLGLIRFNSGHAPASSANVTVTAATFLCPVRFTGNLSTRIDTDQKISVPTAQLKEVFER